MSTATHRATLREPISRRRELALQFGVLVGMAVVGAALVALGFWLHRGDERIGRREAALELERVLESGERALVTVEVTERHWWDHFRTTPGVLAATDRRLLWVGTAPPPLFRPRGDDPPAFLERSMPYDTGLVVRAARVQGGTQRGIVVQAPEVETGRYAVTSAARIAADSLVRIAQLRRQAQLAVIQRQQEIFDSIAALPPPPPTTHRVRPGETLYGIAATYAVTPEVLRTMNGLASTRIVIGQQLVVRRYRRISGTVVPYFGAGQ